MDHKSEVEEIIYHSFIEQIVIKFLLYARHFSWTLRRQNWKKHQSSWPHDIPAVDRLYQVNKQGNNSVISAKRK